MFALIQRHQKHAPHSMSLFIPILSFSFHQRVESQPQIHSSFGTSFASLYFFFQLCGCHFQSFLLRVCLRVQPSHPARCGRGLHSQCPKADAQKRPVTDTATHLYCVISDDFSSILNLPGRITCILFEIKLDLLQQQQQQQQ